MRHPSKGASSMLGAGRSPALGCGPSPRPDTTTLGAFRLNPSRRRAPPTAASTSTRSLPVSSTGSRRWTTDVAPGLSEPFHADPGVTARIDVHLPPLRTLELEVRSAAEGTPIPNAAAAWVVPDPAALIMNHEYSAEGNSGGRIHVGPLAPGAFSVEVSSQRFRQRHREARPEEEGEIHRVVSLELGLVLAGRVLDRDGRAVPGAWMTCGRGEEGRNQTASTDRRGGLSLRGPAGGSLDACRLGGGRYGGPHGPGRGGP